MTGGWHIPGFGVKARSRLIRPGLGLSLQAIFPRASDGSARPI